jgi:hypothetical protein
MTVIWEDLTFEDLQRVMWAILPKAAQIWKDHQKEFYQIIIVKLRIFTHGLRSGKGRNFLHTLYLIQWWTFTQILLIIFQDAIMGSFYTEGNNSGQ